MKEINLINGQQNILLISCLISCFKPAIRRAVHTWAQTRSLEHTGLLASYWWSPIMINLTLCLNKTYIPLNIGHMEENKKQTLSSFCPGSSLKFSVWTLNPKSLQKWDQLTRRPLSPITLNKPISFSNRCKISSRLLNNSQEINGRRFCFDCHKDHQNHLCFRC